jgi:hypothetical protein
VDRTDRLAGAILCAFSLWVLWLAWPLPFGGIRDPGPGFLPRLLAVLLLVSGAIVALRGSAAPRLVALDWTELPRVLAIAAGMGFAALALESLGFRLTMFALLVYYLGIVERCPIGWVIALSIGLPLAVFHVIDSLLRVPLPRGVLGW